MTDPKSAFLKTVTERGFVHQCSDTAALDAALSVGSPKTCYIGFDCTADSLHVGSLLPIMLLRWFQKSGHKPIVLMGGGTTKVGDPSGKDESRQLITEETIAANKAGIQGVFEKFLTFGDGPTDAVMVDNADWLDELDYIPFLRDYGRHFSVNRMLSFESVKLRLDREQPLSFLEFNYMILQAYDFMELNRRHNCILQMGGDDQWANILSGVDLIRRVSQNEAFGWTYPLLTTASGRKMGKTEKGAVWLDPEKTSPYEYYQYWINCEDADVEKFLTLFTFLPLNEIRELSRLQGAEIREAKSKLALETTSLAHGREEALKAEQAAESLFGSGGESEDIPSTQIDSSSLLNGLGVFDAFRESGLCKSNGEARRLMNQGGLYLNQKPLSDPDYRITKDDFKEGSALLRAGKKRYHRFTLS